MAYIFNLMGILANLYDAAAGVAFICLMSDRADRRRSGIEMVGWSVVYILALTGLSDLAQNYVLQALVIIGLLFLYARHMFAEDRAEQFLVCSFFVAVLIAASAVTNIVCMQIFTQPAAQVAGETGIPQAIGYAVDKLTLTGLLAAVVGIRRNVHALYGEWQIGMVLVAAGLCMGASVLQIWNTDGSLIEYREQMLAFLIGFVILCVTSVICIRRLNRQRRLELENEVMKARLEEEQYAIERIRDLYEENQIFRHDLKRYLTIIQGLLISGDVAGAKNCIETAIDTHFQTSLSIYTSSSVVNAVLTDRKNLCGKLGMDFRICVYGEIPEAMQLDIGIILSNLLENAYEAELSEPENKRYLSIQMQLQKDMYYIYVENFISQSVLESNPDLQSGKPDKKKHGFGISSVKKMTAKASGSCSFYEEEHRFIAEVSLPISKSIHKKTRQS